MVDCRFQVNKHLHMYVADERGAVTIVSSYTPGKESTHFEDLRQGIESEGRLASSAGHRFDVEIFLLNDHFGEIPVMSFAFRLLAIGDPGWISRGLVASFARSTRVPARCPMLLFPEL
jgi:hypothetical protein